MSGPHVSDHFFAPVTLLEVDAPIDAARGGCPAAVVEAFKVNLESAHDAALLPVLLAVAGLIPGLRIQAMTWFDEGTAQMMSCQMALPKDRGSLFARGDWDTIRNRILLDLDKAATPGGFLSACASDLLRQGLVALWGAFEVLAHDLYAEAADAGLVPKLPTGSTYSKMKKAMKSAVPGCSRVLEHPELEVLYARRNLIAHRRGIIDAKHAATVPGDGKIGTHLPIRPEHFEAGLRLVRDAGADLLNVMAPTFVSGAP